jgi:hypothetical protein
MSANETMREEPKAGKKTDSKRLDVVDLIRREFLEPGQTIDRLPPQQKEDIDRKIDAQTIDWMELYLNEAEAFYGEEAVEQFRLEAVNNDDGGGQQPPRIAA